MTGWRYYVVGPWGGPDDWSGARLLRHSDGAWEELAQQQGAWLPGGPPERTPVTEVTEADARDLVDTWVAMRMTPPGAPREPAPPPEPAPYAGDLLRRLQWTVLVVVVLLVLAKALFW